MSKSTEAGEHTVSYRAVDVVVGLLFLGTSGVVRWESWRVGAESGGAGRQAGYCRFYIGLMMFSASLGTVVTGVITKSPSLNTCVEKSQLKSVLQVLSPAAIFVGLTPW